MANGYNKIILMGNIVRDPEIRMTPNKKKVAKFTLANNTGYGEYKRCDFFNCTCFRAAEFVEKYLTKGALVVVDGEIHIDEYEGKDGIKRKAVNVMADTVTFAGSRGKDEDEVETAPSLPQPEPQPEPSQMDLNFDMPDDPAGDVEIPF